MGEASPSLQPDSAFATPSAGTSRNALKEGNEIFGKSR